MAAAVHFDGYTEARSHFRALLAEAAWPEAGTDTRTGHRVIG
ncbi:hypothetical protein HNR12_004907 [Streptomonospora nanhaiensis]|uniref:Uncharacterized protein n=1 Tax=Streptomonospora nanhaiensis TaxID=1323731 RepID=A0A853BUH4_9ACTN|nr:hypothetical protein [Streptomonospora nanhaiensis]